MKLISNLLLLIVLAQFNLLAQEAIIAEGRVLDAETHEGIPFVNIGIEGTLIGTASNANGEFSFNVPTGNNKQIIYFSAIGYTNKKLNVDEFLNTNGNVELQALSYGIGDIEISTKSKVLYKIVEKAGANVSANYVASPYNCIALYQDEIFEQQVLKKKRDAMVLVADRSGYVNNSDARLNVNYKFLNVQRNFEIVSLADGTTSIDDLLSFDLARNQYNILDSAYIDYYSLELIDDSKIDDDSVWIIGYKLNEPSINQTGDAHAQSCEGMLYISKKNYAVLKAEAILNSPIQSSNGRLVFTVAESALSNVNYRYIITYKLSKEGYVPDRIDLNRTFTNSSQKPSKQLASLQFLRLNFSNPEMIEKRQYFENLPSDPDFWSANNTDIE